jgi:2Fe-2S ferredoxin
MKGGAVAGFTLETRSGDTVEVAGKEGVTLLKLVRRAGVEELEAQCGGTCVCVTCHVYVFPPEQARLAPIGPGESRMLATAYHRDLASRLACQLRFDESLDGMRVRVAPINLDDI